LEAATATSLFADHTGTGLASQRKSLAFEFWPATAAQFAETSIAERLYKMSRISRAAIKYQHEIALKLPLNQIAYTIAILFASRESAYISTPYDGTKHERTLAASIT